MKTRNKTMPASMAGLFLIYIALIWLPVSGSAMAQDKFTKNINISGTVVDSSRMPISGAVVKLAKAGLSATTSRNGKFTLSGSTVPQHRPPSRSIDTLTVSKDDYLNYARGMTDTDAAGLVISPARGDHPKMTEQHVFEIGSADFPSCHAPTILELPDGTLLCAFFGGSKESAIDVEIRLSRKPPGGKWSAPISVADGIVDGERHSTGNPVLFQEEGGKTILFYRVLPGYRLGMMKTSIDGGKTWSAAREIGEKSIGPEKNKAVQLADGTILSPSADRNGNSGGGVRLERSTDGGETWEALPPIKSDIKAIQPTIMIHPDGRLQMACRGSGKIPMTWSDDNGKTWTPLEDSVLPGNWSGIDAVTLRDGRQFLTYNHVPTSGRKGHRRILNAAISRDGRVWDASLVLGVCDSGQFSYPAVIQSRDGLIHIVHTWHRETINHIVVNPTLLETVPMTDGQWPTEGPLAVQELKKSPTKNSGKRQNPGAPVPDGGYTWCADEGDAKTFDSPVDVAYGAEGRYKFKLGATGTVRFDNDTFGDPINDTPKEGFWRPSKTKPDPH